MLVFGQSPPTHQFKNEQQIRHKFASFYYNMVFLSIQQCLQTVFLEQLLSKSWTNPSCLTDRKA